MSETIKMSSVRYGLTVVLWATAITFVGMIMLMSVTARQADPATSLRMMTLAGVCGTVGKVMVLFGMVMCLKVDSSVAGHKLIVPAVLASGFATLDSITSYFMNIPSVIASAAFWSGLAGTVLFLLFLQQLALHFQRRDLARMAYIVMGLSLAQPVVSHLGAALNRQVPSLFSTIAVVYLVVIAATVVCSIRLLANLRTVV